MMPIPTPDDGDPIVFTNHAMERASSRNFTVTEIIAAMRSPASNTYYVGTDGAFNAVARMADGRRLRIVYVIAGATFRIITVTP